MAPAPVSRRAQEAAKSEVRILLYRVPLKGSIRGPFKGIYRDRGSKDSYFKASGPKDHTIKGFWAILMPRVYGVPDQSPCNIGALVISIGFRGFLIIINYSIICPKTLFCLSRRLH